MRKGTWLRPMVKRVGVLAHYYPGHELDEPFDGAEIARCGKPVLQLPPAAMRQDWRCVWEADDTCRECALGLSDDEA